jgi:hypothetical protein
MKISVTYSEVLGDRKLGELHPSPNAVCEVSRVSEPVPDSVKVQFNLLCPGPLQGGHFSISSEVARWLAGALLAAADKHTDKFPLEISIEDDAILRYAGSSKV